MGAQAKTDVVKRKPGRPIGTVVRDTVVRRITTATAREIDAWIAARGENLTQSEALDCLARRGLAADQEQDKPVTASWLTRKDVQEPG